MNTITYIPTSPHSGRFEHKGQPIACDSALSRYMAGTPACKLAKPILTKWKEEAEHDARRNEQAWNDFTAINGNIF